MINSIEDFENILNENLNVEGGFTSTQLYIQSMKPQIESKFPQVLEKINELNQKISSAVSLNVEVSSDGKLSERTKNSALEFLKELTIEESLSLEYQIVDAEEILEVRGTILATTIGYIISTLKQKREQLSHSSGGEAKSQSCDQLIEEAMNARTALVNELFGELNQQAQAMEFMKSYLKNYLVFIINPIREYAHLAKEDEAEILEMSDEQKKKNQFYQQMDKVMKVVNNIDRMIEKVKVTIDPMIEENGMGDILYPRFISASSSISTENYISKFQ